MAETPGANIERAGRLVEQVLEAAPLSALAHNARAILLRAQGHPEEAIPEYELVIAQNRNWAAVVSHLG